ncbi:MAG: CDP-diacylglycerol--serine O-phosphatidyltransferase [Desulfococcus sp. 4484_241]|nr:MAG: CDP-diacylglycerol--serine O-phosphatidyltransferase [Desulfococcus sp. 4484_241]
MKTRKRHDKERMRRGVYILPNLFTTMNLFAGFFAVLSAINGNFEKACLFVIGGMVCDILDGKTARLTKTTSRFGVEYDSLADLITFGLAPGIMAYLWTLKQFGKLGWLAALLFLACGALRLARFNTNVDSADSAFFTGLPIPGAAGMVVMTILFSMQLTGGNALNRGVAIIILVGMFTLSFLMVSSIRYTSFKKMPSVLVNARHFNILVIAVLLMVLIVQEPVVTLFILILLYVLSGPVMSVRLFFAGKTPAAEYDEEEEEMDDLSPIGYDPMDTDEDRVYHT